MKKPEKLFENGPEWAGGSGFWEVPIGGVWCFLCDCDGNTSRATTSSGDVFDGTEGECIEWLRARVNEYARELVRAVGRKVECWNCYGKGCDSCEGAGYKFTMGEVTA